MYHHPLRYRQIHLDFHTSPDIANIGGKFDKKQWQETLKIGHVDSITCFSKCHHGWSYHPTKVGKQHPHLQLDLLRAQFDASKEIDVNVPVYLSAGLDNVASYEHPEWRRIDENGQQLGWGKGIEAGFHLMCMNGPYLEYLCDQIREATILFKDADGIFLDIINPRPCCCRWCIDVMHEHDLDPRIEADRDKAGLIGLERYLKMTTEASQSQRSDMPVFHNSGHIQRGNRKYLDYFTHLEIESLPTGGWGYDHFPLAACYARNLPRDVIGMTGKFHSTWGEFGGYKHPNALRYECAAMLAMGTKCSVGDQVHPEGNLDLSTYRLIGEAYKEVEQKEPWCNDAKHIADIGLLSSEAVNPNGKGAFHGNSADVGAARILLESQFLFDVIDTEMDFSKYKVLVLPDDIRINQSLKQKIEAYLAQGGKLFLTGESGLNEAGDAFAFDIGATWEGQNELSPDFIVPNKNLQPSFVDAPFVMYKPSQRIKVQAGQSLGQVFDPYFNRTYKHFCSHQHTPYRPEASGYDCGVQHGGIMYLAHPIFTIYAAYGAVSYKSYVRNALCQLLGLPTVTTNLPSTARVTLTRQEALKRYVLHLLYATTIKRGDAIQLVGTVTTATEVIEDLIPLHDISVQLKIEQTIKRATLEPQGQPIDFKIEDGQVKIELDKFTCHQMIVLHED